MWLTIAEYAKKYNKSKQLIDYWIKTGKIKKRIATVKKTRTEVWDDKIMEA